MLFEGVFERFVEKSPVSVMNRIILERMFAPEKLDFLFENSAESQYAREQMFSKTIRSGPGNVGSDAIFNSSDCGGEPPS